MFRGTQNGFCRSVYTPALLAAIVFGGIGISAAHENNPGMNGAKSHARAALRNDRSPFSGVQVKSAGPLVPRPQKGPAARTFEALFVHTRPLSGPGPQTPSRVLRFQGRCGMLRLSAGHKRACCFLFCGA